jgi:Na+/glutamate symporter
MKSSNTLPIENNLTRQSTFFLMLAVAFGVIAGAIVTMYYYLVTSMDAIEDKFALIQAFLYLTGVLINLVHLPGLLWDEKNKAWKEAFIQALLGLTPLVIFVGADGLISHLLWWNPLSDTDRFHILHNSLLAGASLMFVYWLAARRWWVPGNVSEPPKGKAFPIISVLIVLVFSLGFGVMFGSPGTVGLVLALLLMSAGLTRWWGNRKTIT